MSITKIIHLFRAYYEQIQEQGSERTERCLGSSTYRLVFGRVCALSPTLFNFAIDWILNTALRDARGVEISPDYNITDLDYADDIAVMASSRDELQTAVESIARDD